MRAKITISMDENLIAKIDEERGLIPRSRFVEQLLLGAWNKKKGKEVGGYA